MVKADLQGLYIVRKILTGPTFCSCNEFSGKQSSSHYWFSLHVGSFGIGNANFSGNICCGSAVGAAAIALLRFHYIDRAVVFVGREKTCQMGVGKLPNPEKGETAMFAHVIVVGGRPCGR